MSWKDIDNPHKKKIDRNFVSCDERDGKEKIKFLEYEKNMENMQWTIVVNYIIIEE